MTCSISARADSQQALRRTAVHQTRSRPHRNRPEHMPQKCDCAKDIRLSLSQSAAQTVESLPPVWADSARVRQILTNLVDNAIKFTPAARLGLGRRPKLTSDDEGYLRFSVSRHGHRHQSCPPRTRLRTSRPGWGGVSLQSRRSRPWTLYIARELVMQHSGRIWVESDAWQKEAPSRLHCLSSRWSDSAPMFLRRTTWNPLVPRCISIDLGDWRGCRERKDLLLQSCESILHSMRPSWTRCRSCPGSATIGTMLVT